VQLAEDGDEFLREGIIGGEERIGRLVAHFLGDEAVHLAGAGGAAEAVLVQTPVDGGRAGRKPGGAVRHGPAEEPDEAELAQGAFAVGAKARRRLGDHVRFCHGRRLSAQRTPPDSRGRMAGGSWESCGRWRAPAPTLAGLARLCVGHPSTSLRMSDRLWGKLSP